jgi:hypothetical protein
MKVTSSVITNISPIATSELGVDVNVITHGPDPEVLAGVTVAIL